VVVSVRRLIFGLILSKTKCLITHVSGKKGESSVQEGNTWGGFRPRRHTSVFYVRFWRDGKATKK